ncbi:MAG: hypothetical protein ACREWI_13560 [Telluria sp.]
MTIHTVFRRTLALPAVFVLATLTGCASQLTNQEMTPTPVQAAKQHPQTVTVATPTMASNDGAASLITMPELRTAVSNAIVASKAFADAKVDGGAYQLGVHVFNLDTPAMGFSMTSKVEMGWTLKRADSGAVVWQDSIKSEHTTGATEAFAGAERVKMSIGGAIRKNIDTAMKRIGTLTL